MKVKHYQAICESKNEGKKTNESQEKNVMTICFLTVCFRRHFQAYEADK